MHDIGHKNASDSKSLLCGDSSLSSIYRFVSTTNIGADVNFPNRISFIRIQNGRRIVYLDDGVSSRVDEREALSQSIRFVWPHYGAYMRIQKARAVEVASWSAKDSPPVRLS